MKIGKLAKLTQCSVETIRYYEKIGLLPEAVRAENNYRYYAQDHLDRLIFIRNCRFLDLSHDEIKVLLRALLLQSESSDVVHTVLEEHIEHVRTRISELQQLEQQLLLLKTECRKERGAEQCGILQGLIDMNYQESEPPQTHKKSNYSSYNK